MELNRATTCCFTGHRPEKLTIPLDDLGYILRLAIRIAEENGYDTFITGMSRGTDLIAARQVLHERERFNHNTRLICAVPYDGFEKPWDEADKKEYFDILNLADEVQLVCRHYSRRCFQLRNKWMVDRSSLVIAAYNETAGGTMNTIKYALKNKITVKNVLKSLID